MGWPPAGLTARTSLPPPHHRTRSVAIDATPLRFRSDFPLPTCAIGAMTPRVLRHDRPLPTGMPAHLFSILSAQIESNPLVPYRS